MSNFAHTQKVHKAIYDAHRTVDAVRLPNHLRPTVVEFVFTTTEAGEDTDKQINLRKALFGLDHQRDLHCGVVRDLAQVFQRLSIDTTSRASIKGTTFGLSFSTPEDAETFAAAYFQAVYTKPFLASMQDLKDLSFYATQYGYQPPTVTGRDVTLGPLINDELKKKYVDTMMYLQDAKAQDLDLQTPAEVRLKAAMGDFFMTSTWGERNGFDLMCAFRTKNEAHEFADALRSFLYNS